MAGDDLTTANISYNPINPSDAANTVDSASAGRVSALDVVVNAFKGMKETATEAVAQFKAIVKKDPSEITQTDVKTSNAVSVFFSNTLPQFGNSILRKASNLKSKVDGFVNKDKEYLEIHNKHFPAWAAGGEEKLSVTEKLSQAAKPLTRRMSELSEASKPALAAVAEKVDALKSIIPNPLELFASQFETVELKGAFQTLREDIHGAMPQFLAKVSKLETVNYSSPDYVRNMKMAHGNMRSALDIQVDDDKKVTYDAGKAPVNAWKVKIDPNKTYDFGGAHIKGSTLLELQKKTRVTYDSNIVRS